MTMMLSTAQQSLQVTYSDGGMFAVEINIGTSVSVGFQSLCNNLLEILINDYCNAIIYLQRAIRNEWTASFSFVQPTDSANWENEWENSF